MVAAVESLDAQVFLPKGFSWDRSITGDERRLLAERVLRLPGWASGDPGSANLDVKPLSGARGLYRLRSGRLRVVFQRLGAAIVVHRADRRGDAYEDHHLDAIQLVRSGDGLRVLEPRARPVSDSPRPNRPPVREPARRIEVQNPLSVFSDRELTGAGIPAEAIEELRSVPPGLPPERAASLESIGDDIRVLVAELWEHPGHWVERMAAGDEVTAASVALDVAEAERRLAEQSSEASFVRVSDADAFEAVLERPIEEWMLFLHPAQSGPVHWPLEGPARIRGAAGTGKTVVALHRARALARKRRGKVLLTTFVSTLPRVWDGLFATFARDEQNELDIRTLDQVALEIHRAGGGRESLADEEWLLQQVTDLHGGDADRFDGLSAYGLYEELEYVVAGRRLESLADYLSVPRTGRGTALREPARREVWEAHIAYTRRQHEEGRLGFSTLRRSALDLLDSGAVRRRYAAVVVDEAQDLTEVSALFAARLAGRGPRPNITLVGDGQQSIYPGGFTLRSTGIDVRGRAAVLRTNWRNTYSIWTAANLFLSGETYDEPEADAVTRPETEVPYPLRDGAPPRLHVYPGSAPEAAAWLVELVADDIATGADPGDLAILSPGRGTIRALEHALQQRNVPFESLQSYDGAHGAAVWLGTFHRAKGLEFKRVYLFGLDAERWPPQHAAASPEVQEDARERWTRAAFVAMTRARDELDVVTVEAPTPRLADVSWAFDVT